ncbi:multiple sugar transport system substrate-binding protein [Rhodoligotrophos appendicifer]|uniref:ABC transporter substrate-binding protein n=1 Tax=Rhodoligotrophos appendicifer TaxID=987056 RepID=UPI0011862D76|nr:ABC transporter substrate-binding protein [Rhodoligotrophos appendicifer]
MKTLLRAALVGAAMTLGALAAHAETIVLDVVHAWPAHNKFHEAVADAFMKQHPDIQIKFRSSPPTYDEAHQALLRGAITNQLPDIYFSGYHLLPEVVAALSKRGQVAELDGFMAKEGADWASKNYEPAMLKLGQVDGRQYGLAFNASTPVIFFNGDLVKQAGGDPENFPTSWAEVIALGAKIKQLGDGVDGMAYDVHAWPDDWLWRALILQQGKPVMNQDGLTVAFGGESGLEALKLARRFVTDGGMQLRDFEQSRQQFAAGKIGILFSSTNGARAFSDLVGDKFPLKSAVYPVADKDKGTVPTGGNAGMILTKDEAKQQAAWEYIKFAAGPEGQTIAVLGSGYMPTNKLALAPDLLGDFYKKNPNWETSLKQVFRAGPWGGYPGNNGVKIWRMQRDIIGTVMRGDETPEAALAKMVQDTDSLVTN